MRHLERSRQHQLGAAARRGEHGTVLIWALLVMIVIAAMVTSMAIMAQRASERSGDSSRRVSNNATVQTATTRIVYGLQNELASEGDYYTFDRADLESITRSTGAQGSRVLDVGQLTNLPLEFTKTYGVWEHTDTGGPYRLQQMADATVPSTVMQETVQLDQAACRASGLAADVCTATDLSAYWQTIRVVLPDSTGNDAPNVVVYVRTWMGSLSNAAWSRASYARIEARPGRFADFELISDGNIHFAGGATIDGPVHTNGLDDGSFATVRRPAGTDPNRGWVVLDAGATCSGPASITIADGLVLGPGGSTVPPECGSRGSTGQVISFLRAIDSINLIEASAAQARPHTGAFSSAGHTGAEALLDPYGTAWRVTFNGDSMSVDYPDGSPAANIALDRSNAYAFDDDVRVRGHVGADHRVTLASRRKGSAVAASIYIDGNILKDDARTTAIGLIAQGDVILWQTPADPCQVSRVQAAVVAATGGVTLPTKYTTNELQTNAPVCDQGIQLDGSISGHRPPTLVWKWEDDGGRQYRAGYVGVRNYTWDQHLRRTAPPYFPLTGLWQPFNVREGNTDCLFSSTGVTDPTCR